MTNEFINLPPPPVGEDIPTILHWLNKVYIRLGGGRNNIIYVPSFASTDLPTADLENGLVFLTDEGALGVGVGGASVTVSSSVAPRGHIGGLTLSNNVTDATNDIDIATGEATSSDTGITMILVDGITKRLDASWAVGTNQGGLDTGSIANATYHVFLIKRSDTGVVDVLFSTSATAPTMPSSYDLKRRIGSIMRISATIVPFSQFGDEFLLKLPVREVATSNPGTSAVESTLSTSPSGIKVNALITVVLLTDNATETNHCLITSLDQTDTAPSSSVYTIVGKNTIAASTVTADSVYLSIRTNTSKQVRYRLSTSVADVRIEIMLHGWIDYRGKHN